MSFTSPWRLVAASFLVLGVALPCQADIPHLIRYQGQAVNSQGVPLEGPYTLTFRLYDAPTAGTKLWEERQDNVPLVGGHFAVLLGSVTSLASFDWSVPCWLSVQVNVEPELAPRQQIASVPLALRALKAEALTQPITPALITPQGPGSGLDADTLDGQQAAEILSRANHTGTQPSTSITGTFPPMAISPQGSASQLDADLLDGKDSSAFATNVHTHACGPYEVGYGQTANQVCGLQSRWCSIVFDAALNSLKACGDTPTSPFLGGHYSAICCK